MATDQRIGAWAALGLALLCTSCADDDDSEPEVDAQIQMPSQNCTPQLKVQITDAWGRSLTGTVTVDGRATDTWTLDTAGEWSIELQAPNHLKSTALLTWSGVADGMAVQFTEGQFTAIASEMDAEQCPTYTAFVGLEHLWFESTARAWHPGNSVELLTDAAHLWARVAQRVRAARTSVFWATWWWASTHELVRNLGPEATVDERRLNRLLPIFEALPAGVERKVLVNQFLADVIEGGIFVTTDEALRKHADDQDSSFQVMVHSNRVDVPVVETYEGGGTPVDYGARIRRAHPELSFPLGVSLMAQEAVFDAASYHMKGVIVDHKEAFVVGANSKAEYWDESDHRVFNSERMHYDATPVERAAVEAREQLPDYVPFQDYGIYARGPIVGEIERVYADLWNQGIELDEALAANAEQFEVGPYPASAGQSAVQVQMTLPPPMAEQSNLLGQRRAIANAKEYILVEDQYWRSTRLLDDIVAAMERSPELRLIVVTNELARSDGGKKWTLFMDQALRSQFPERYALFQLRAFDVQTQAENGEVATLIDLPVYNHSKLLIIDDVYLSVGSANKNNRSLLYDGEMNLVVLDKRMVSAVRQNLLARWVGRLRAMRLTGDIKTDFEVLGEVAVENTGIVEGWRRRLPDLGDADIIADQRVRPHGHLFPYTPEGDYLFEVGPDFY